MFLCMSVCQSIATWRTRAPRTRQLKHKHWINCVYKREHTDLFSRQSLRPPFSVVFVRAWHCSGGKARNSSKHPSERTRQCCKVHWASTTFFPSSGAAAATQLRILFTPKTAVCSQTHSVRLRQMSGRLNATGVEAFVIDWCGLARTHIP